jgi:DNA-binding transcriptional LysR family regulator
MLIDNLSLFLSIVNKGSLVGASREHGLSSTTVSERLAALEAHYGVTLLNRTTRAISMTDEGRALVDGAEQILQELTHLEGRIRHGAGTLSGPIRISAPSDIGRSVVSPILDGFLAEHPAISIELILADGFVDIVGQGIDIALRFGTISDSSLRIRTLKPKRRIVCAAADYFARHGTPHTVDDLTQHNCVLMRFGQSLDNVWQFQVDGKNQFETVRGNRVTNDGALAREWAIKGFGVVMKSELDVACDIKAGRLVEVLGDFAAPARPFQMLFPPSRNQPLRVRACADTFSKAL